jgi:hypothetical protein
MMIHTFLSSIILSYCLCEVLQSTPPSLPLPAHDIPSNLNPPLASGRVDVHGWLWLPINTNDSNSKILHGWFYHHTPEFWTDSAHDFEIMVLADLVLDNLVTGLPVVEFMIGTEYVFTPPAFSLDELITGKVGSYYGRFTNGSFDTPQRYLLSNGTLNVVERTTVHYLEQNATVGYIEAPYYSYPRAIGDTSVTPHQLYFLHLEEKMPEYDQILHVTLDPETCKFLGEDTINDVIMPGATFVFPTIQNDVLHRAGPWIKGALIVNLMTSRNDQSHTQCLVKIIEEIHCVVIPDSFAKCPTVNTK